MPNPCRQRSFWARIKLSEKKYQIPISRSESFFAKKIFDSSDMYNVQIYCFFTTTFQVLFKTFKIWLGLIARFNFSRNTQIKQKKHAPQQKPNLFVRASVVRTYSPEKVFQNAFPPSAIFLSIPISREASQTLLSFVMLPNVPSFFTLSNHFSKKFQKKSEQEDLLQIYYYSREILFLRDESRLFDTLAWTVEYCCGYS